MKQKKRLHWSVKLLLGFGILLAVAYLGLRWYLSSDAIRRQVLARVQEAIDSPVQIEGVSIGLLGDSTVKNLQLFEDEKTNLPWLSIDKLSLDVSAMDVMNENVKPKRVEVSGAHVHLRFAKDGSLLTRIPKAKSSTGEPMAFPKCTLENGKMTLDQEGHPPLVVQGVNAEVSESGEIKKLTGTINDPHWGQWKTSGELQLKEGLATLTVQTDQTELTQQKLESLPFVPKKVWEQIQQVDGKTSVELTLKFNTAQKGFDYRLIIKPQSASVYVRALELKAEQTQGKIEIKNQVVMLENVTGKAASGQITTSGNLDFREPNPKMNFQLRVKQAQLTSLPDSWKLPKAFEGELSGQAQLTVTVADRVQLRGTGTGTIENAIIAGATNEGVIPLKLIADEKGIRYPMNSPMSFKNSQYPLALRAYLLLMLLQAPEPDGKEDFNAGYLQTSLNLKIDDLALFLNKLEVKLPVKVAGKGNVKVKVWIPVAHPRSIKRYRVEGSIEFASLTIDKITVEKLLAVITLKDGLIKLTSLKGEFPGSNKAGTFAGDAQFQLDPLGDLIANLTLNEIALERFASLIPTAGRKLEGRVSGRFSFRAPGATLHETSSWVASGVIRTEKLLIDQWSVESANAKLALKDNRLAVTDLTGRYQGLPLSGIASLTLDEKYPYQAELQLDESDFARITQLYPDFKSPIPIKGSLALGAKSTGTLSPFTATVTGKGTSSSLEISTAKVTSLQFKWSWLKERVLLTNVTGVFHKGNLKGHVTIPLNEKAEGDLSIDFERIDLDSLSKSFEAFPIPLLGVADGTVKGSLSAVGPGKIRNIDVKTTFKSPQLSIRNIPTESLKGNIRYTQNRIVYDLQGRTLGGTFDVRGVWGAKADANEAPQTGKIRLIDIELSKLWNALATGNGKSPLSGKMSLKLDYEHDKETNFPVGTGQLSFARMRWGRVDVSSQLRGRIRVSREMVNVVDLEGDLAGGTLLLATNIDLEKWQRSRFQARLNRVSAQRLLKPFFAESPPISGKMDVSVQGQVSEQWRGQGRVAIQNGKLNNVSFTEWLIPFDFFYSPRRSSGEIDFRESRASIARGRVVTQGSFRWGTGNHLQAKAQFFGIDLQQLLRSTTIRQRLGKGKISGRLQLTGRNIRSMKDLKGTLDAEFRDTQALTFPVLQQFRPFLRGQSPATTFQRGKLRADLSNGIVRIRPLALESEVLSLMAEGTVTVAQGRLNLDVNIRTGQLVVDPVILRLAGVAVGAPGSAQVATQLLTYLSNRVVHLRVRGTISNPSVRVEPLRILTQEGIRFLLLNQIP